MLTLVLSTLTRSVAPSASIARTPVIPFLLAILSGLPAQLALTIGLTAYLAPWTRTIRTHFNVILLLAVLSVTDQGSLTTSWPLNLLLTCLLLDVASLIQCQLITSVSQQHYVIGQLALSSLAWTSLVTGNDDLTIMVFLTKLGGGLGLALLPSMYNGLSPVAARYVGIATLLQATFILTHCGPHPLAYGSALAGLTVVLTWIAQGLIWNGPTHILALSTGTGLTILLLSGTNSIWTTGFVTNTALAWILLVGIATNTQPQSAHPASSQHKVVDSSSADTSNTQSSRTKDDTSQYALPSSQGINSKQDGLSQKQQKHGQTDHLLAHPSSQANPVQVDAHNSSKRLTTSNGHVPSSLLPTTLPSNSGRTPSGIASLVTCTRSDYGGRLSHLGLGLATSVTLILTSLGIASHTASNPTALVTYTAIFLLTVIAVASTALSAESSLHSTAATRSGTQCCLLLLVTFELACFGGAIWTYMVSFPIATVSAFTSALVWPALLVLVAVSLALEWTSRVPRTTRTKTDTRPIQCDVRRNETDGSENATSRKNATSRSEATSSVIPRRPSNVIPISIASNVRV